MTFKWKIVTQLAFFADRTNVIQKSEFSFRENVEKHFIHARENQ